MRRRTTYDAAFKAKVAIEALRGEQTILQISNQYNIDPWLVTNWQDELVSRASLLFSTPAEHAAGHERIRHLEYRIQQITRRNRSRESARLGRKAAWLWLRYRVRRFLDRGVGFLPLVIFVLSLTLSGLALFFRPYQTLTVQGTIAVQVSTPNGRVTLRPMQGVIVEAGGFQAVSNAEGGYILEFDSPSKDDIPIIFRHVDREEIIRIDFPDLQQAVSKDFTFR